MSKQGKILWSKDQKGYYENGLKISKQRILGLSLIKDLLRAWKVLGCHYLKSGNSLDETHREEISQPVVKN